MSGFFFVQTPLHIPERKRRLEGQALPHFFIGSWLFFLHLSAPGCLMPGTEPVAWLNLLRLFISAITLNAHLTAAPGIIPFSEVIKKKQMTWWSFHFSCYNSIILKSGKSFLVTVLLEINLRSMWMFGVMESHRERSELCHSCAVFELSWWGFTFCVDWMIGNPHLEFAQVFTSRPDWSFFV